LPSELEGYTTSYSYRSTNPFSQENRRRQAELQEQDRRDSQKHDEALNDEIDVRRRKREEVLKRKAEAEQERKRKEQVASKSYAVGALEHREVSFDHAVAVPNWSTAWTTWRAYGPARKNGLWTTYDVEPVYTNEGTGIASTSDAPSCCLEVVDFAAPYYNTPPGRKKVDALTTELEKLTTVRSNHVLQIYAVSVSLCSYYFRSSAYHADPVAQGESYRMAPPLPAE
jgi:hypothetical protein